MNLISRIGRIYAIIILACIPNNILAPFEVYIVSEHNLLRKPTQLVYRFQYSNEPTHRQVTRF